MSELKPCPFCGTKSVSFMPELLANQQIYCKFCETSIIFGGTIEWDTKRFNTRPIEDAQAAEIEALKAKVAELETADARMRYVLSELLKNGKEVKAYHPDNVGMAIIETTVDTLMDMAELIEGEG